MVLTTYLVLQLGRLPSNSLSYSGLNAVGAALILVSLVFEFNMSAFLIELFWLLISLVGIGIKFRADSSKA